MFAMKRKYDVLTKTHKDKFKVVIKFLPQIHFLKKFKSMHTYILNFIFYMILADTPSASRSRDNMFK